MDNVSVIAQLKLKIFKIGKNKSMILELVFKKRFLTYLLIKKSLPVRGLKLLQLEHVSLKEKMRDQIQ